MAVRQIIEIPDERLRVKFTPVQDVNSVQTLIDDMLDTLYGTDTGVGLAAPQVGDKHAVVVIDISETHDQPLVLINPEIIKNEGLTTYQEGCLSVPGIYADVERYQSVTVRALDRTGKEILVQDDDFLAIVMQHEIDHLHGKIFIDYLSSLKRSMALKKMKKFKKSNAE
ncbi:peptide deformylase [Moellerella wisconsensis]|uniref:peptide deformylase n=1 Tax=Moellerella wisconsensis TaxID=158849 RepID=UPI001F4E3CF4|nr:peptide deformylase [Moellerella wisconsensis]UNH26078.1 peptide deformylase [Moellerella wisconsensis]